MKSRTTFVSSIAALALSAVIAVPALAGPPTFSGFLSCTSGGAYYAMEEVDGATKKEIGVIKKTYIKTWGFCDKGSVDTSLLVKV